jgi:hypothetical protein
MPIYHRPLSCAIALTCRVIAKWQLCEQSTVQQPLLGNSSLDTLFPRQRENTQ